MTTPRHLVIPLVYATARIKQRSNPVDIIQEATRGSGPLRFMALFRALFQLLLCTLIILPGSGCGGGNSGTGGLEVSGQARSAGSHAPLAGIVIRVKGTDISVVTDENGNYSLNLDTHSGEVELEIEVNGVRSTITVSDVPLDAVELIVNLAIDEASGNTAVDGPIVVDGKPRTPKDKGGKKASEEPNVSKAPTQTPSPTATPSPTKDRPNDVPNIPSNDSDEDEENDVVPPQPTPDVPDTNDDSDNSNDNKDLTAPSITSFTLENILSGSVTVNVKTDEISLIELQCLKGQTEVSKTTVNSTSEANHKFANLEGSTQYKIVVLATDASGNSSTSEKTFTTPVALQSLGLVWTDPYDYSMSAYSNDGKTSLPVLSSFGNAISYSVDPRDNTVYWVDGSRRKAFETTAAGKNSIFNTEPSSEVIALDLDFSKDLVFWSDRLTHKIYSRGLSQSESTEIAQDSSYIYSIELDTKNNKVYWYTWDGSTQRITRANYDGSSKEVIYSVSGIGFSVSDNLKVDPTNSKIYFVQGNTICRLNYDGSGFETLINYAMGFDYKKGFGIDLARQRIYFANWDFTLSETNLDGSNQQEIFPDILDTVEDINRLFYVDTTNQFLAIERLFSELTAFELNFDTSQPTIVQEWSRRKAYSSVIDQKTGDIYWLGGGAMLSDVVDGIYKTSADGSEVTQILAPLANRSTGIHFDSESGRVFYADEWLGQIVSMKPDGSDRTVVIDSVGPRSLAVDFLGGQIYWTEAIQKTLNRVNVDGSGAELVLQLNGDAKGVDLDFINRKVYWVNDDPLRSQCSIERVNFDGSNREIVVDVCSTPYLRPKDLVVDALNEKVYWIANQNAGNGAVFSAGLDGSSVVKIVDTTSPSSIGLEVDNVNQVIYFLESEAGQLMAVDLDGSNLRLVRDGFLYPIAVSMDNSSDIIFITDANGVQSLNLNSLKKSTLAARRMARATRLAIDSESRTLYWAEQPIDYDPDIKMVGQIKRANLNGTEVESVLEDLDLGVAHIGLAVDSSSHKIYYTTFSGGVGYIHQVDPNGSNQTRLVSGISRPHEIAVGMNKIFWSEVDTKKLRHCDLNGSNVADYWQSSEDPPFNVAIDEENSVVYWSVAPTYSAKGKILSAPASNSNARTAVVDKVTVPGNITIRKMNN